ncbi:MAG: DUF2171 domain-containing protein [Trueperaceae bacterium]
MDKSSTDYSDTLGDSSNTMSERIREHMMVHATGQGSMNGIAGEHVGTVDYVEDGYIVLTKNDAPDEMHHSISFDYIDRVEGNTVFLNVDAQTIQEEWETVDSSDKDMDGETTASDMSR